MEPDRERMYVLMYMIISCDKTFLQHLAQTLFLCDAFGFPSVVVLPLYISVSIDKALIV